MRPLRGQPAEPPAMKRMKDMRPLQGRSMVPAAKRSNGCATPLGSNYGAFGDLRTYEPTKSKGLLLEEGAAAAHPVEVFVVAHADELAATHASEVGDDLRLAFAFGEEDHHADFDFHRGLGRF